MLDQVLEPARTLRHSPAARRWAPWLVFAVGLGGEALVLVVQAGHLWFFRDDFGYLLRRPISQQPGSLLAPRNEHWSTLPIIAFRLMWLLFGLRHYLPYALMPVLLHLAVAVCLALLVRRAGAGAWPAVLTGLVFAYLGGGAGAENPLWASNIGFIGSCLGGVVALLCFDLALAHREDRRGRRWFWIGELSLVAALMCSGMGVPMIIAAGAWAFFRSGPAAALRTVALPVVVFAGWFVGWGHTGFSNTQPLAIGLVRGSLAGANAIGHIWSAATSIPGAGPVVLLVLVVAVVLSQHHTPLFALGAAGLVGLVFEYLIVGFGRSQGDFDYPLHSRYLHVGLVLCAPAVACLLELLARRMCDLRRASAGTWLVAAVLIVVVGPAETAQFAADRRAADPGRKQELLAAAALIRSGAPLLSDRIDPSDVYRDPAMSVSALKAAHGLAALPPGRISSTALFDEQSVLQVNVQEAMIDMPPATDYHWSDHWTGTAAAASSGRRFDNLRGCTARTTTSTARLDIPLGAHGAQVEINFRPQDHSNHVVRTQILRGAQASILSPWPLDSEWNLTGPTFFVASTMHYATLEITLPAGEVGVCSAGRTGPGR